MKKTRALLLVLLLLLPSLTAFAETGEWATYTHPTDGYSLRYPADWVVISRETFAEIADQALSNDLEGLDADAIENYRAQLDAQDLAIFADPSNSMNVNVQYIDVGQAATVDDIIAGLLPDALESFATLFPDCEMLVTGEQMQAGENLYAYIAIEYAVGGVQRRMVETYLMGGTTLYVHTYTIIPTLVPDMVTTEAVLETIAASFTPGAQQ